VATNDYSNVLNFGARGGASALPRDAEGSGASAAHGASASSADGGAGSSHAAADADAASHALSRPLTPAAVHLAAKVRFMNIANIHTMRASRKKLSNAVDLRALSALEGARARASGCLRGVA
jgi:hypothetical protein